MADERMVVLVTGGTGLVGNAIKDVVNGEKANNREEWIFLSSKDGNLWYYMQLIT